MVVPASPSTSNPGLRKCVVRALLAAGFLSIFIFFMTVHVYYTSAALLDLVVLLVLFLVLSFFGLSITSLVMTAVVGPGELPSRFSAARMETFIREELQRVIANARRQVPTVAGTPAEDAACNPKNSSAVVEKTKVEVPNWTNDDEAESKQLANVASAAAILRRSSPTAEEEALERAAVEARLCMYTNGDDPTSYLSDGDTAGAESRAQRTEHSGDDSEGAAGEDNLELPPYMTEAMQIRRQRKIRRGLEIVLVSHAACKVLEAIDSTDMDRKQEEMRFLIPGANWCRFCNFYQMNDTRHCNVCNRCVYRSKLHCVCCGQCIGYANSKYYVLFLLYLCLSLVVADALDLYCVSWGYTFFFKASGEANSVFYLVFVYSSSFAVAALGLLAQYLYAAGRGLGLLTDLLRQQRDELQASRACNNGEQYQPVLSERSMPAYEGSSSPAEESLPFSWRMAMKTVGEGLPLPLWFWPTPTLPATKETDDPPGFWDAFKEAIRLRLRSVADEDDVFSDEDVLRDTGAVDAFFTNGADPSSSHIARVAPQLPTATTLQPLKARMPYDVKSEDVTMVTPVSVEVPSTASLTYMNPSAPPAAKVAPAPKHDAV